MARRDFRTSSEVAREAGVTNGNKSSAPANMAKDGEPSRIRIGVANLSMSGVVTREFMIGNCASDAQGCGGLLFQAEVCIGAARRDCGGVVGRVIDDRRNDILPVTGAEVASGLQLEAVGDRRPRERDVGWGSSPDIEHDLFGARDVGNRAIHGKIEILTVIAVSIESQFRRIWKLRERGRVGRNRHRRISQF